MDVSDSLLSLFSAQVEHKNGSYVVTIPKQEVEVGQVAPGDVYKIGVIESSDRGHDSPTQQATSSPSAETRTPKRSPPVEEGDIKDVEIEDMGEKGDGIARIGPGYIVFVEGTTVGDHVEIEITEAKDNFAFGEVIEHLSPDPAL